MATDLFDKRLLVVTGKGGVGKSTLSAALALAASRRGKRVLVCEVNTKERIPGLLGGPAPGTTIGEVVPGISSVNVQPKEAMREYGLMKLKFQTIYDAVFENRMVRAFLRMIPSLAETVMLGKVWFEVVAEDSGRPRWDLVILDAPATGHGLSFLRVPQVIMDTVPPGPLREDAERMHRTLTDAAMTSVQLVSLPEEMPINETMELHASIRDDLGLPLGSLFLNGFVSRRFTAGEVARLAAVPAGGADSLTRDGAAAAAGRHQAERAEMSEHYARKLELDIPELALVRLPRLYSPTWGPAQVGELAGHLDGAAEAAS